MSLTISPDMIIWVAAGLAKGYITVPRETPEPTIVPVQYPSSTPHVSKGIYQEKDSWWYFRDIDKNGTIVLRGPYSERGAKMVYTKFLRANGRGE